MGGSASEQNSRIELEAIRSKLIDSCKVTNEANWVNSVACMNRISLSKVLFYNDIIQKINDIPGVVIELGVQWGATTSLIYNLTSIFEPFNFRRKIIGFDTFSGFPESSISDSEKTVFGWNENDLATISNIQSNIDNTLTNHQAFAALPHITRHELIKGDVCSTLPDWFLQNEHETVALCIFDMDLGIPTDIALQHVLPRCQKGTILVFDEYNHPLFREEGSAARKHIDILKTKCFKSPFLPYTSYFVL